jgi:tRNA threonylcarbamoyladenosine modification (KEOPS) complex  Pcc1 subunit
MKAKATVRLRLSSEKNLTTLLNALAPEANATDTKRARVSLNREEAGLVLRVEAGDTVALRTSLNVYLRWICSAMKVIKVIENSL